MRNASSRGESLPTRLATFLCARLRERGARRAILLGTCDDMEDSRLKHEMARRGVQVFVPPADGRAWLEGLLRASEAGALPSAADAQALRALIADGLEHGVDAVVLLCEGYERVLGDAVAEDRVVRAWDLRERAAALSDVVFDMGNVLLKWEPLRMARAVCDSEKDAALLAEAVFGSPEWVWQDAGAVDEETVAWVAKTRVPERLHAAVDQLAFHWYDDRAFVEGMGELIAELKVSGFGVYLLSNAGSSFERYCDRLPGWDLFDGVVVSYAERLVKPDARIYRLLLERFGLVPATSLFVDDTERNVLGARRVGMQGYHFDGDAAKLRRYLLG